MINRNPVSLNFSLCVFKIGFIIKVLVIRRYTKALTLLIARIRDVNKVRLALNILEMVNHFAVNNINGGIPAKLIVLINRIGFLFVFIRSSINGISLAQ